MIFVNFKIYEQGTGVSAINLVKVLETVAHKVQIKIIPVEHIKDVLKEALVWKGKDKILKKILKS